MNKLTKEQRVKRFSELVENLRKHELEVAKCIKEIFDDELYLDVGCNDKRTCIEAISCTRDFETAMKYYRHANWNASLKTFSTIFSEFNN